MRKGENRASEDYKIKWYLEFFAKSARGEKREDMKPCIFLSHKREDKEACLEIGKYLENAGIDYYLDIFDQELQNASEQNDPIRITTHIKNGIYLSTHMIVVVSEKTIESRWVPFEIGYGHASIVDNNTMPSESNSILNLAFLTLKEISDIPILDFLQIATPIRGIRSLNEYLEKIKPSELELKKSWDFSHPLNSILDRYK